MRPPFGFATYANRWHRRLKWVVYALLVVDFFFFLYQDIESAPHTLSADPSLLQWMRAYVTSIDLLAWFVLIACFELETGPLAGRLAGNGRRSALRAVRLACVVAILHTTYADIGILRDVQAPRALPAAVDLCAYTDGSWSFLRNRGYTTVAAENCANLGRGPGFFAIHAEPVVTDRAGLTEALILAWTDVAENLAWLLIVLATEIAVRMQLRGISGGTLLTFIGCAKTVLYTLIVLIACYWGSKGQILYFWDEILWLFGFLMIEGNLRAQRAHLLPATRPNA